MWLKFNTAASDDNLFPQIWTCLEGRCNLTPPLYKPLLRCHLDDSLFLSICMHHKRALRTHLSPSLLKPLMRCHLEFIFLLMQTSLKGALLCHLRPPLLKPLMRCHIDECLFLLIKTQGPLLRCYLGEYLFLLIYTHLKGSLRCCLNGCPSPFTQTLHKPPPCCLEGPVRRQASIGRLCKNSFKLSV